MSEIQKIDLRNLKKSDYQELRMVMTEAYTDIKQDCWEENQIHTLIDKFQDGQIVVFADDVMVGVALSIIVDSSRFGDDHTYLEITGNNTFNTHDSGGDTLYGIDVFVRPDYRGMRFGRRLYDARKELCENLNLKTILFGGRMPNFHKYATEMKPRTYIEKVLHSEIYDPVLTFQFSNDFHVRKIIKGYMPEDKNSKEFAALLEWNNIYYDRAPKLMNVKKSIVRIGLVQWQMRTVTGLSMLYDQMEYFVDAVSGYNSDFTLFPELFNAPLMAEFNHLPEAEAMRELAKYTEDIRNRFKELAISYNTNIITGSMPYIEDGHLYNVGFLCRRDGSDEMYRKLHITPNETAYWGMTGGDEIKTFDTDCGRIGIMICYDVEFPELSRLMALDGMQILFIPFLTDTQNGFTRVKHCAQARAVENECYVAIAGSVGNLPKVRNMDIQYAQSAVFTPSDFAFPPNGIKAETTPNTEMTLMVDVDLDLLKELHEFGSVRTIKDRRTDLYQVLKPDKN